MQRGKYVRSLETREKNRVAILGKSVFPKSATGRESIRKSKLGDKNPMWLGDSVGKGSLHKWIRYRLKEPERCEECREKKKLDLANVSGRYLRELTDWRWLCRKCHMLSDGRMKNLIWNKN